MTRSELVARLSWRFGHLERRNTDAVVTTIFRAIANALADDARVELRGFGVFSTKSKPERTRRNPRSGKTVVVSSSRVPAFKTGGALQKRLNPRS